MFHSALHIHDYAVVMDRLTTLNVLLEQSRQLYENTIMKYAPF